MKTPAEPSRDIALRRTSEPHQPLFRQEVIVERQSQWLGAVLLVPRISHFLLASFALAVAAAIVGLLFYADYTRKERITGWLVPEQGLVQVFAPQPGVITQLNIKEDSEVQRGAPLMVMSTELQSKAFGATQEEVVRRLRSRRDSLATERELHEKLHRQKVDGLTQRITALEGELEHRRQELVVQRQRIQIAEAAIERLRPIRKRGLVVEQRWQQVEGEWFDQTVRLRTLVRDISAAERQRVSLKTQLKMLPLEKNTRLAEINRMIDTLEQELVEAESRRQIVLPAPQSGTVTAVQVEQGSSVKAALPLLSIIPSGSELEAQLFIPSRAIGFIRPGQPVLLRYRAFPFQKFGHYEGTVSNVSRSSVTPGELSPALSGITNVDGAGEPIYLVKVALARQTANAYGKAVPLQPGMQLEADVLIETRRLIEWVLDPLYTLTGSWTG